jgi:general secretion pathway protein K
MNFVTSFLQFNRFSNSAADAKPGDGHRNQRGWALISVLWTTAMLGMMAAATQDLTVTSVRAERRALARVHLEDDLDAAVARAVLALDDTRVDQRWRVDSYPYAFTYDNIPMKVSIQDEEGKFDLNEADDDTLVPLFESVGVSQQLAAVIADRIVEWRTEPTSDDAHTLHGGTDADYAAAHVPWRPRHADLQSVAELNLVLGMTPALFARVRPAITVYSRNDSPDEDVAPEFVLNALYPGNPGQVQKIMSQHNGGVQPGLQTGTNSNTQGSAIISSGTDLAGRLFEIDVEATWHGRHETRRVVVLMTPGGTKPYLVQHWE